LVVKNWDMFRRKHFTLGIATQFFYVAAQSGISAFSSITSWKSIPV